MKTSTKVGIGVAVVAVGGLALLASKAPAVAPPSSGPGTGYYTFQPGHRYQITLNCPTVPQFGAGQEGWTIVSVNGSNPFIVVADFKPSDGKSEVVQITNFITGCTAPSVVDQGAAP